MDGIVTILDDKYYQFVSDIWQDLKQACNLQGNESLTVPHFSWHVAEAYPDESRLDVLLEEVSLNIKPFTVQTTGLGIFFQPRLVVYIPVIKTPLLIQVHQQLWDLLTDLSDEPTPYYSPELWVPHITLTYEEMSDARLACVIERLSDKPLEWEIQVNNLSLIGQSSSESGGVCIQHSLRGEL